MAAPEPFAENVRFHLQRGRRPYMALSVGRLRADGRCARREADIEAVQLGDVLAEEHDYSTALENFNAALDIRRRSVG